MMNKPYLPWSRWLKTSGYGTDDSCNGEHFIHCLYTMSGEMMLCAGWLEPVGLFSSLKKVNIFLNHLSLVSSLTVSWSFFGHLHSGCQSTIHGALIPGDCLVWPPAEVAPTIPINMTLLLDDMLTCVHKCLLSAMNPSALVAVEMTASVSP